jgi:CubicO group peptidase (beta-lactamase class C family)
MAIFRQLPTGWLIYSVLMDCRYSIFSGFPQRHFRAGVWPIAFAVLAGIGNAQAPVERMNKVVQQYADAQMFMGSVLVAQHGKVLFSKSYGWADAEWNIPNTPTTRFQIASVTKQFTAASILLLEERGKLKTEDAIRKYLPDAPTAWDKITIYNLLTMTSGIAGDAAKYEPGPPDRLVFRDEPLDFQPGENWDYTNEGYMVLGYLVEKISGQSYPDFLMENIFKPLGMNDSGPNSNVAIIPHRASGYLPGADAMENAERPNFTGAGLASGGIYSTTEDMLRWENGLFGGKLLRPASLRKMTTPFKHDYACGLYVRHVDGRLLIDYDGNNIGFNAQMAYYPEDELAVVILANLNGYVTGRINTALAGLMHGETVAFTPPPREIPLPKGVLAQYVGTYEFPDSQLVLTLEGSHLMAHFGATFPLFAESETKFFSKGWDLQFEFSKNDKGELTSVTKHFNGQEEKGIRK